MNKYDAPGKLPGVVYIQFRIIYTILISYYDENSAQHIKYSFHKNTMPSRTYNGALGHIKTIFIKQFYAVYG